MKPRSARCTNNSEEKYAEVSAAMERMGSSAGIKALWKLGAFRHREDVAYAVIMLSRGEGVAEIFEYLVSDYQKHAHSCAPVFPR